MCMAACQAAQLIILLLCQPVMTDQLIIIPVILPTSDLHFIATFTISPQINALP